MSFSQHFISRPRLAAVVSIVISLAGLLALLNLPVTLYPSLSPVQVSVSASYPGASAGVVDRSVVTPLEEQLNGVDGMVSMQSTSSNQGTARIRIEFAAGTDADVAQINVQNRVALAEPGLPEEVRRRGLTVRAQSSDMLLGVNLVSPDGSLDQLFLSNYASRHLTDALARVEGVSDVSIRGERQYSMRIWLRPDLMQSLGITVDDVQAALREQNQNLAIGRLGQAPTAVGQQFEYSVQGEGRMQTVAEFENTVLRASPDGSVVRLRDLARVEVGAHRYSGQARLDGAPTALLLAYQSPSANAVEVAQAVRAEMARLARQFPEGMDYAILYDTTTFISRSVTEVVVSLMQAIGLVILVVFLFLKNWRMTLIPALAIPVSLLGALAALAVLGYSINTLTLFALVLATGVVVDDAIVVIENVERHMAAGKDAVEATRVTMQEVAGPVVATTLVLLAVFVPVCFMPGVTGGLYRQFAVTISAAVLFSSLNALTLSPALCAVLLKSGVAPIAGLAPFERGVNWLAGRYSQRVSWLVRRPVRVGVFFLVLLAVCFWLLRVLPTGFVPREDQGFFFVSVELPDGASIGRTDQVLEDIRPQIQADAGVAHFVSASGFSPLAGADSSNGFGIVLLKDWSQRPGQALHSSSVMRRLQQRLASVAEAKIRFFEGPSIPGLGSSGGFDLRLQDTQGGTPQALAQAASELISKATQRPEIGRAFSSFRASVPEYSVVVDRDKARMMGVSLDSVYLTLRTQLGSLYVNDFPCEGRSCQVIVQADQEYRAHPDDLRHYAVRSGAGDMVPLSTLVTIKPALAPPSIDRFNMYPSVSIRGQAAPGYSSGQAMTAMAELAQELPVGYGFSWAGQSRQALETGAVAPLLFMLALVFVYLFLVAQYESWTLPVAVVATAPIAIWGVVSGLGLFQMVNTVYAQIGMVLLMGLAAKTAILIVEFASVQRAQGMHAVEAAEAAARTRFRAVLMTVMSFVLGVVPLICATGPGSAGRVSLGSTVFFGMLATLVPGTLLMPVLYRLAQGVREWGHSRSKTPAQK